MSEIRRRYVVDMSEYVGSMFGILFIGRAKFRQPLSDTLFISVIFNSKTGS